MTRTVRRAAWPSAFLGALVALLCLTGCGPAAVTSETSPSASTAALPPSLESVEPVVHEQRDGIDVIRGQGVLVSDDALTPALGRVRQTGPLTEQRRVVVELPATEAGFLAVTRGAADATTGAVTLSRGDAVVVVVNPRTATDPADVRAHLLAHELVHALCDTAAWRSPRWVAEGWAEHVAAPLAPAVVAGSDAALADRVARLGIPSALPEDAAFGTGDVEPEYAMARVALDALASHVGEAAAARVVAEWGSGERGEVTLATAADWWREAMAARS